MLRYSSNLRKTSNKWFEIILGFTTLNALVTLCHAAYPNPHDFRDNCGEKCFTDSCADEALKLIKLMDDQVDPCEDFYEFVCGTFRKEAKLEPDDNVYSVVSIAQNEVGQDVFRDLGEKIKESDWDAFKKVKTYYRNCMDTERTNQIGNRPLLTLLDAIGGWPVLLGNRWDERSFDLWQSLYRVKAMKAPSFFPVVVATDIDNVDSRKYTLKLGNCVVNANPVWFSDPTDPDKVSRVFLNMMLKAATILGARNDSTTLRELQQVLDFELNLHKIATPAEQLVNVPLSETRMTIRELTLKNPGVPWLDLINRVLRPTGLSVDDNEIIYLIDPKFVSEVTKLIHRTPKRVLANFIGWRVVQLSLGYLPKPLGGVSAEYDLITEGTSEQDRSSTCYEEVSTFFPVGLSALYVNRHFKDSVQGKLREMYDTIIAEARKTLEQNTWMDTVTKQRALEKLDAISVTIGHVKELNDRNKVDEFYRELEINPGSSLANAFNTTYFNELKEMSKLRKSTSADKWSTRQAVTNLNANYNLQENSIELPAAFVKIFFGLNKQQYMNYGIAGSFIGHEIFHGFDNQGKQYDKDGNQVNWWTPDAEQKFKQKAQCIIDQYSNYTVPEVNMKVKGELSQGENIADNGGFRIAYLAYKEYTRRHNIVEACLPSFNYTPEQMFWISAATPMCSKERPEYIKSSMLKDPHSPDIARVNVLFTNFKEFADDFNCKLGSKMNPIKKCKVW